MRIGLDLDNTIVCYDRLFHRVACDFGLADPAVPASKLQLRNRLRAEGREHDWTELQGLVYGPRMGEAEPFPGVSDFLSWARGQGLDLWIISHKTRHPARGPRYDLREAARTWIARFGAAIPPERVLFEETKHDKIRRIGETACAVFVDDLPEILLDPAFPEETAPILFDPDGHHGQVAGVSVLPSWQAIRDHLEARCSIRP
jgi:hypothetical protein